MFKFTQKPVGGYFAKKICMLLQICYTPNLNKNV